MQTHSVLLKTTSVFLGEAQTPVALAQFANFKTLLRGTSVWQHHLAVLSVRLIMPYALLHLVTRNVALRLLEQSVPTTDRAHICAYRRKSQLRVQEYKSKK